MKNTINRRREVETLLGKVEDEKQELILVYGPRNVGITTILEQAVDEAIDRGIEAVYIDAAAATENPLEALRGSTIAAKLLVTLTPRIGDQPLGPRTALYLPLTMVKLALAKRGSRILITVDHVDRGLGQGRLKQYIDAIRTTIEKVAGLVKAIVVVVAVTPLAAHRLRYPQSYAVWGLDRRDYGELLGLLGIEGDEDYIYRLTGGNAGETVLIKTRFRGDIGFWLNSIKPRIRKTLKLISIRKTVFKPPRDILEIDQVDYELASLLTAYDIIAPVAHHDLTPVEKPDPDRGIGFRWAWQLPAYYYILAGRI